MFVTCLNRYAVLLKDKKAAQDSGQGQLYLNCNIIPLKNFQTSSNPNFLVYRVQNVSNARAIRRIGDGGTYNVING